MLEGKIALVIGASRRIDRQITLTLGQEGTVVIVNYDGSAAEAEKVVKETGAVGDKAEVVQCNVSDFESCGRMMANMVSKYDRLDVLVDNAGIIKDNLSMGMSEEDFDVVINMDLRDVFNCIRYTSRQILKQKAGRIINIFSVSGVLGNTDQTNYCTAETGVIGITKPVVRELVSRGITVNTVAPGFIATEMVDVLNDSVKVAATEQIPMKYSGSTQDTAEAAAFLASDKIGYIIGQVLSVDGGVAV